MNLLYVYIGSAGYIPAKHDAIKTVVATKSLKPLMIAWRIIMSTDDIHSTEQEAAPSFHGSNFVLQPDKST